MIADLRHVLRQLARSPGFTTIARLHARTRHRREHRHVQRGQHAALPARAVPERGTRGAVVPHRHRGAELADVAAGPARRGGAERVVCLDHAVPVVELQPRRDRSTRRSRGWRDRARATCSRRSGCSLPSDAASRRRSNKRDAIGAAVISDHLWQHHFRGDPQLIGRQVRVNGENVEIIGVLPASADYPQFWGRVDLWRPLPLAQDWRENRDVRWLEAIARLKPGMAPTARRPSSAIRAGSRSNIPTPTPARACVSSRWLVRTSTRCIATSHG